MAETLWPHASTCLLYTSQAIIESVVKKVQTTQENERKETELQIARKDIAIQRARGEAEGAMKMSLIHI